MKRRHLIYLLSILIFFYMVKTLLGILPIFTFLPPVATNPAYKLDLNNIKVAGWIAWWKEDESRALLAENPGKIYQVSPVWFYVSEKYTLEEKGKPQSGIFSPDIEVVPTLASELTGRKLSGLFDRNSNTTIQLVAQLNENLKELHSAGLDVDIEGILEDDKERYLDFLSFLKQELSKNNLKLIVTVHTQNGRESQLTGGQDLKRISEIADEVRVMAYDQHGKFSGPGSITSLGWLRQVVNYNKSKVPSAKLTIGLPSYGYVWEKDGTVIGLQYDEFQKYLEGNRPENTIRAYRDPASAEMVYESEDFTGWLSDSEALYQKMKLAGSLGINSFVIWNLGGMDGGIFRNYGWL